MAKTKPKTNPINPKVPGKAKQTSSASTPVTAQAKELLTLWQDEIANLRSQTFASVNDAIDALIDGVLKRLGNGVEDDRGLREMMKMMFETDPELLQEIEGVFKLPKGR